MKVTLEPKYLDAAKAVITEMKECDEKPADVLHTIAAHILKGRGYVVEVLKATAHTARNYRAWKAFCEESGQMDVWIEGVVFFTGGTSPDGFIKCGGYLTDYWNITSDNDLTGHMYYQIYTR